MKYLLLALVLFMTGCQSFQRAPQSRAADAINSLTRPLMSGSEATTGPIMFVGALTILIGVIALWGFRKVTTGIGMIATGFGIALLALWLRDYALLFLLVSLLLGFGYLIWLVTDVTRRRKLKKRAKQLLAQGRGEAACVLEEEADA